MKGNLSKAKGFKGETGAAFKYEDFTPEQLEGLRGYKGDKGDSPAIVLRYDATTGNLYYNSDGILVDKEYVESQNLVTKEELQTILNQLSAQPLVKTTTIELLASKWVKDSDNQYSQVVSISGITENSKVDLQPTVEQLLIFYEKDLSFVTENEDGVVTIYCIGQKPLSDYTIQATITEVKIDG